MSGWAQVPMPLPYSDELVKKAEEGDAVAQWSLGCCYKDGKGVKINKKEAFEWYTKSAEQGNADAQHEVSHCFQEKAGEYMHTPDNLPRMEEAMKMAKEWNLKSAEAGNRSAQSEIAHAYYYSNSKGEARIQDLEEAKKWYTRLQEKGVDKQAEKFVKLIEWQIQKEQRQLKTK